MGRVTSPAYDLVRAAAKTIFDEGRQWHRKDTTRIVGASGLKRLTVRNIVAAEAKARHIREPFVRRAADTPDPIHPHVYATEQSNGRKTGPLSTTHVSQESCPPCPLRNNGCYAENGFLAFITNKLNARGPATAEQLAIEEVIAMDKLSGERDLRLHIAGDCKTRRAAEILAAGAEVFMAKHGRRVFTYTHAWRTVPRFAWGRISVIASCETIADTIEAMRLGYAAELTVMQHQDERRHTIDGVDVLPCPEQTRGRTCADCRLCMDDQRLHAAGIVIAFAAHGRREQVRKVLA